MRDHRAWLIGSLAACLWLRTAEADPTVSIEPSMMHAEAGTSVSARLLLSSSTVIDGGGILVRYDPRILRVRDVHIDKSRWSFVNRVNNHVWGGIGVVEILVTTFGEVSGDVELATIEFDAAGPGSGRIALFESESNPFASGGQRIPVKMQDARVQVRQHRDRIRHTSARRR